MLTTSPVELLLGEGYEAEDFNDDRLGRALDELYKAGVTAFQLFTGIHVLTLPDGKKLILNMKEEHRDLLSLLSYWNFYA